jgi:hypothetical protein
MRKSLSGRVLGVIVAACAAAAGAGIAASPAPGRARACPSLDTVKAYQGTAGPAYSDSATATIPNAGPTAAFTIAVSDQATLNVNLSVKHASAFATIFQGAVVGVVHVSHTRSYSGSERPGHLDGSALGAIKSAFLLVSPQLCKYQVNVTYSVTTTFGGDAGENPGSGVSISATSPQLPVPASLELASSAAIPVYDTCGTSHDLMLKPTGCYSFSGGWREDFQESKLCHTFPPVGNCATSGNSWGTAQFSWKLLPVY